MNNKLNISYIPNSECDSLIIYQENYDYLIIHPSQIDEVIQFLIAHKKQVEELENKE